MLNGCKGACSLVQLSLKDDSSKSTLIAEIFYDFWDLILIEAFLYIFRTNERLFGGEKLGSLFLRWKTDNFAL